MKMKTKLALAEKSKDNAALCEVAAPCETSDRPAETKNGEVSDMQTPSPAVEGLCIPDPDLDRSEEPTPNRDFVTGG
jgi:hypothetical protein